MASSGTVPPPATPSSAPTAPPPTPHQHQHLTNSLSGSTNLSSSLKRVPNFQVHIPTAAFLRGDWNADYPNGTAPVAKVTPNTSNNVANIFFPTPLTSLKMSGSFSGTTLFSSSLPLAKQPLTFHADATITQTVPITPILLSPNAPGPVSTPPTPTSPPNISPLSFSQSTIAPTFSVTTPITHTPLLPPSAPKPNPFLQTPTKRSHEVKPLTQPALLSPITTA